MRAHNVAGAIGAGVLLALLAGCSQQHGQVTMEQQQKPRKMEMSADMKLRCEMFMKMAVSPYDPGGMLAIRDELGLTKAQVKQLREINDAAVRRSKGVLTAAQTARLRPLERLPRTAMQMHQRMLKQMHMKKDACPMMKAMEQAKQ